MQMTPVIAVHMTAALLAVAIGPVALWARRSQAQRPRLHRAFCLYIGACLLAGSFTLLPQRFLGQLLWGSLGLA